MVGEDVVKCRECGKEIDYGNYKEYKLCAVCNKPFAKVKGTSDGG